MPDEADAQQGGVEAATIRPMHPELVEPPKRWADVVIPRGGRNAVAVDIVVRALLESPA